ncbi:LysR family transcriptional regulator [Noviherbaspirillum malthae]|jgi:DNA-binding transcriptional LysR family regulator|uniref:LysR family transcriptional regulator n=1 Tax=Noviherbaspirillum malthae TaxID=1260987 RepID=UPI00188EC60F|nr:LysR family transcriptional regulator [Noviherbaspirillum malthae]
MTDRLPEQMACIAVFARVAELRSFSAAARALGTTKSAVSKQVARLEQLMNAQLLRRTTRSVSLTDAGELVYERALHAIALCRDAEARVGELGAQAVGLLRVSAPLTFGQRCIGPLVQEYLKLQPGVQVQLVLLDREVDLAEEGFDVAIRLNRVLPNDVIARELVPIRYLLCAAAGSIAPRSLPKLPKDLTGFNCLRYGEGETSRRWRFRRGAETQSVEVSGNMLVNNSEALRRAMLDGAGIALLPDFVVEDDLKSRRAVELLPKWKPEPLFGDKAYAIWLPDRRMLPKTRTFLDFLSSSLPAQVKSR